MRPGRRRQDGPEGLAWCTRAHAAASWARVQPVELDRLSGHRPGVTTRSAVTDTQLWGRAAAGQPEAFQALLRRSRAARPATASRRTCARGAPVAALIRRSVGWVRAQVPATNQPRPVRAPVATSSESPASLALVERCLVRLGCPLCPAGTYTKVLGYLEDVVGAERPEPFGAWLRDALSHLRRHAAIPLTGAALVGTGTLLWVFTGVTTVAEDVMRGLAGGGTVLAAIVATSATAPLRARCAYRVGGARPRRAFATAAWPTGFAGALLLTAPAVLALASSVFNSPSAVGTALSGLGLVAISLGAAHGAGYWTRAGAYATAAGALVVAFGSAAPALYRPLGVIHAFAAFTAAGGCLIYAGFIRDILRTNVPAPRLLNDLLAERRSSARVSTAVASAAGQRELRGVDGQR